LTEETETVKVTLELPKQVADWFTDETAPLEKRLTDELVELCLSQIDGSTKDTLIAKYGLGPVFKEYELID
jgi:hypothetical protein